MQAFVTILKSREWLTVFKVELVKIHALHQVSQSFRLKRSQARVTDSPVIEKQKSVGIFLMLQCLIQGLDHCPV